MAIVTVRIQNDAPSPARVSGVVVYFYDAVSAVFQTSGTTDVNGEVVVVLPDGSYDLLFYKQGVTILPKQPQRIIVDELLTNTFLVSSHVYSPPESIDPTLITVSGRISAVDGQSYRSRLVFSLEKELAVINSVIVAPASSREVPSDEQGNFQFELLRNTEYFAYFVWPDVLFGEEPGRLCIQTPDLPSVRLTDLLFPLPLSVTFSEEEITLIANNIPDETIEYDITFTDGSIRSHTSTPWAGTTIVNSNNLVVDAALRHGRLILTPHSIGVATITTIRQIPQKILYSPLPSFTSETVTVTVV